MKATGSRSFACTAAPPWRRGARAKEAWSLTRTGSMRSHQARQPVQVPGVEPRGRAQRQADAVQADRPVLARRVQHLQRGAAVGEEVLRMHLDEGRARARSRSSAVVVRLAQADAGVHASQLSVVPRALRSGYFLTFTLASSAVMPFMSLQVPLATYFHSSGALSALDWPAQECVPDRLAQSFWPALAMP